MRTDLRGTTLSQFHLAFHITMITRHFTMGCLTWEQTGQPGTKMCQFVPSAVGKGRNIKSVHSTWVCKATLAGMKSAAFCCQTWLLDALIPVQRWKQRQLTRVRRPRRPHIWMWDAVLLLHRLLQKQPQFLCCSLDYAHRHACVMHVMNKEK